MFSSENGGEGLIVHDDDVRRRARLQHAEGRVEVARADLRVVLEEHVRDLAPRDIRRTGIAPLRAEGYLQRLEHIIRVGIRAHAQEDARLGQRQDGADADGVAHVGFGLLTTIVSVSF